MPRQTAKIVRFPRASADCERLSPDSEEQLNSAIAKLELENMQLRRLLRLADFIMKGGNPEGSPAPFGFGCAAKRSRQPEQETPDRADDQDA